MPLLRVNRGRLGKDAVPDKDSVDSNGENGSMGYTGLDRVYHRVARAWIAQNQIGSMVPPEPSRIVGSTK